MATTNRSCNLECVEYKAEGEAIEFIGPVKIILVDQPPNIYRRRVWGAALIVLIQMMMGATTMTLLFYALSFQQDKFVIALHIFLCTVGYQLCLPSGILSLNKQNGASAPMKMPDRKFEHSMLQAFGISLTVAAAIFLFLNGDLLNNITLHSLVGMATSALSILAILTGLVVYNFFGIKRFTERFGRCSLFILASHKSLGITTFILSSVCFILGISRPHFEKWVPVPEMVGFLYLFCAMYTAIVLYRPLMRIMTKLF